MFFIKTPSCYQIIDSRYQIIDLVMTKCRSRNIIAIEGREKFKEMVLLESLNYVLKVNVIKDLAEYIGINYLPPPEKYSKWVPTFCENLKCMKYYNPTLPQEYITLPSNKRALGSLEVLYHSPKGYDCVQYFNEFVPQLCLIEPYKEFRLLSARQAKDDPHFKPNRGNFSKLIGNPINKEHSNLDEEAVRAIHALIDVYVPSIEGVCINCFNIRFPKSGLGMVYQKKQSEYDEIEVKISPPKPDGHPQQQVLYVTNTLQIHGQPIYVKWAPWKNNDPIFTSDAGDVDTHFPWNLHDQNSLNSSLLMEQQMKKIQTFLKTKKEIKFALCQCKQNIF